MMVSGANENGEVNNYIYNGLDYKYVYGNDRLSVDITSVSNSMSIVENGDHIRLYYHMDYLGTGQATVENFYTYDELHRVVYAKENYGNATAISTTAWAT